MYFSPALSVLSLKACEQKLSSPYTNVQQWKAHKIPAVNTTIVMRWENTQEAQLYSGDETSMFLEKN